MAESKPRLLVSTSTYPRWPGDSEPAFVHGLCRRLAADWDVTVLAPHAPGARTREIMDGVAVRRFRYLPEVCERLAYEGGIPDKLRRHPLLWLQVPFLVAAQCLAVLRECLRERVDLIHAHWVLPQGLVAVLASRLVRGAAVVGTAHGADLHALDRRPLRWLKSWTLRRLDALTVVSAALRAAAEALGAPPGRLYVAPMGVDVSECFVPPNPAQRQPALILFVGRLVRKKGVEVLLEAFRQVRVQVPEAQLVIAGDGPERRYLEQFAGRLGLGASVRFTGALPQAELVPYYQSAAVAAFPFVVAPGGDREGLGLVAVEAQACGCPVVASDLPAVRDVIEDGANGILVPDGSAEALARALLRVLGDPPLAARLGANGRRAAVERFDWNRVAARYREILEHARRERNQRGA